jgi:hypothetical protein
MFSKNDIMSFTSAALAGAGSTAFFSSSGNAKKRENVFTLYVSVADPDPGSEIRDPVPFRPPGSGMGKKTESGSGIGDGKNSDPGWKSSDPGNGKNIPDPQHCLLQATPNQTVNCRWYASEQLST